MTERHLQGGCAQLKPPRKPVGYRTRCAADQLRIVLKRKLVQPRGLVHTASPSSSREHAVITETMQVVDLVATGVQLAQRCVHPRPSVESGHREPRGWKIDPG